MSEKHTKRIWITWERHRRTRTLSDKFGTDLHEVTYKGNLIIRYLYCIFSTIYILFRQRPDILVVQTPSYILSFLVALLKYIFRYALILDAHNGVTYRLENENGVLANIIKFAVSKADLVIVTNETVYPILNRYQKSVISLPDCVPDIKLYPMPEIFSSKKRPLITLIASFQHDEPIEKILEACEVVFQQAEGHVIVTGKLPNEFVGSKYQQSSNITFTGYLSFEDFDGLIGNSDLLIDVSTDSTVLVCGGYEAISVGVPAIVSSSLVSRAVFSRGFIYSDCSVDSYVKAIYEYLDQPDVTKEEMILFKSEFTDSWQQSFDKVEAELLIIGGRRE